MSRANIVTQIAARANRQYITPGDVGEAMNRYSVNRVRLAVLQVLAGVTDFGSEDIGCCAFVAWRGKRKRGNK